MNRLLAYRTFWLFAALALAADRWSKAWIVKRFPFDTYGEDRGARTVVRGFFYLVHVGNTGAAWSVLTGHSVLLALLAGATLTAIYLSRRSLGLEAPRTQVCFGLLCGGIVGNLIDRLVYRHVIDFIDLHFGTYTYPTFNLADSAIFVGIGLYMLGSLRKKGA